MLPWIIGGLAAAALLWLLTRRKKKEEQQPEPKEGEGDAQDSGEEQQASDGAGDADQGRRKRFQERSDAAIDQLAARITFSSAPSVQNMKVGEHLEPSQTPTGTFTIEPFRDIAELRNELPSSRALDDDMYLAKVAARSIPVRKYQERVEDRADVYGPPRKALVLLVDVSGSMDDDGRMPWALRLCRKIVERAEKENAEVFLLPFESFVKEAVHADTTTERKRMITALPDILTVNGGTDINGALFAGLDIVDDPSFTERRIQLVTDGTQGVDIALAKQKLAELKTELNTVCIGQDNPYLRAVSHRFDLFA